MKIPAFYRAIDKLTVVVVNERWSGDFQKTGPMGNFTRLSENRRFYLRRRKYISGNFFGKSFM